MRTWIGLGVMAGALIIATGCGQALATRGGVELIPRETLFGNPSRANIQLSRDGQYVSYLAPVDGVLNVWVAPADAVEQAKPITHDRNRGIRAYFWAYDNEHILYTQDKDGDENWRVYAVNVDTRNVRDLTDVDGVAARIVEVSPEYPSEILVGLNQRNPALHDVYRVDIATGHRELLIENEGFAGFVTDDDFDVRFAQRMTPGGGSELLQRADEAWEPFLTIEREDTMTTSPAGFDKSGMVLRMTDSRGRDTAALVEVDLRTGERQVIAQDSRADIADVLIHPTEKRIEAVAFNYERKEWKLLDDSLRRDFDYLRKVDDGDIEVTSRTLDDDQWIVAYLRDDGPVNYYFYDRPSRKARFLFTNRPELEDQPLVPMHPVVITARDGLKLVSYLSLPKDSDPDGDARPREPLPTVLFVHGGPWARDSWGYSPYHQWLANRGYAVLAVNFRGSTGFGKSFVNAADLQWGRAMHDDLIDAVEWAKREKIADPERVAIMGGSYGGYAVLWGLTNTPEAFACGVDIVGPSSLITLLESIPPYWKPILEMFAARVGDPRTEEGRALLKERSPLTYVENIEDPLLIAQGANDPRVKQAESEQIVEAMQRHDIPVTYVLFPDEGHGFARPENSLAFVAVAEAFLSTHLGGRYEPIGDDFEDSSVTVPTGAGHVPGLEEALAAQ